MEAVSRSRMFSRARRVVIKIGTSVVTTEDNRVDTSLVEHLVEQIANLVRRRRKQVLIVTSGAVAAGMQVLGWKQRPQEMKRLQAAASVGQSRLMRVYERSFRDQGRNVGQVLLTRDIFHIPGRKENARQTLQTLLDYGVIPVINENDSVAVEEMRFGDNDKLSALVAELVDADLLVMLTDVDGLHTEDPRHGRKTEVIPEVKTFARDILGLGSSSASDKGRGGMKSKMEAARYLTEKGKACLIANGKQAGIISRIFRGEPVGTLFHPKKAGRR